MKFDRRVSLLGQPFGRDGSAQKAAPFRYTYFGGREL